MTLLCIVVSGAYPLDYRLRRALLELTTKGVVPEPDRLMDKAASVSTTTLNLDYDGQTFYKDAEGQYHIKCACKPKGQRRDKQTRRGSTHVRMAGGMRCHGCVVC